MRSRLIGGLSVIALIIVAAVAVHAIQSPTPIQEGSEAPKFALVDQNGKTHKLADYKGQWLALAFYPADMTPGCTLEAKSISDAAPELKKLGAIPFGISVQDSKSKAAFCEKEGLEFTLLADTQKSASKDYGVLSPAGFSNRVTFVVNPEGKVAKRIDKVDVRNHGQELVATIKDLKGEAAGGGDYVPRSAGIQEIEVGDKAPAFNLPDVMSDKTFSLEEVLKKEETKGVVLVYVSHECPVHRAYDTRLKNLNAAYKDKGIVFLGIDSCDPYGDDAIRDHFNKIENGYPILRDRNNIIADKYGAKVTPEVYLIDKQGVIRYWGAIDDSQNEDNIKENYLDDALRNFLANQPIDPNKTKAFGCTIKRVARN